MNLSWVWQRRFLWKYALESSAYLLFCGLLKQLPHKYWGLSSCCFQCETLKESVQTASHEIQVIARAVRWGARYLPWPSNCLDQALAVQRMLARRGLKTTLYLGMIKDAEKKWSAHAWVRCGDQWVIGYDARRDYTVVGTYAKIP